MSEGPPKENPEALALRARPRAVTRLNRRSLLILVGGAGLVGMGACLWAFRARPPATPGRAELRSTQSVTRAEGLDRLPKDYDAWRPVPRLGPASGELGRPVLHAEQNAGLDPEGSNTFRPNPEEEADRAARLRLHDEAEAAAKAQVFFQISHSVAQSALTDMRQSPDITADTTTTYSAATSLDETPADNVGRDQLHKASFADSKPDPAIYANGRLREPLSPYELMAGSVIPAALVTGINSDLPGQAVATVTQNVYDTISGNFLLVPQGSKILGQYDSQIAYGQRRVLLVWTRLILPEGTSITLDGLQGTDVAAYSGLEDQVDSHWARIFAGAALSTLLGVNSQLVNNEQAVNSGSVTVAVRHSSQDSLNQVGQQITRKSLNVQPTLTVRPGFPLRIIVNKDLVLRPQQHLPPQEPRL